MKTAVAAVMLLLVTACTPTADPSAHPTVSGGAAAACMAVVEFRGTLYYGGFAPIRSPRPGRSLGTGTAPPCHEYGPAPSQPQGEAVPLFHIPGIDPQVAVLSRSGILLPSTDGPPAPDRPPAELAKFNEPVVCTEPVTAAGAIGTISADPRKTVHPPYTVELRVTEGPLLADRYSAVVITFTVTADTQGRGLTEDKRPDEWTGRLSAALQCDGPDFVANTIDPF